jgi:hypothetical protein
MARRYDGGKIAAKGIQFATKRKPPCQSILFFAMIPACPPPIIMLHFTITLTAEPSTDSQNLYDKESK